MSAKPVRREPGGPGPSPRVPAPPPRERAPFPSPESRPPYQPPPSRSVWRTVGIVVLLLLAICGLVYLGLILLFLLAINSMGSNK